MSKQIEKHSVLNVEEIKRMASLIAGYVEGVLSEKEQNELDEWIGAAKLNQQIFDDLTNPQNIGRALEWLEANRRNL
ncbi:MAG: hypothetical protein ABIR66_13370 [Saprospiraceae bacterium]